MAGITLETAKRHLDAWLEAELAVTNAQSYKMCIRDRVLTIADIKQLKKNYEAAQQIPGQMDMNQFEDQQQAAGEETTTAERCV